MFTYSLHYLSLSGKSVKVVKENSYSLYKNQSEAAKALQGVKNMYALVERPVISARVFWVCP